MKRNRELPRWLVGVMIVAGVVFLGPPLLGFLFGAVGLAMGLAAALFKLGLVALGIYMAVMLFRAVFRKSPDRPSPADTGASLENTLDKLERDDAALRALDRELEQAVAASSGFKVAATPPSAPPSPTRR